MEYHFTAPAMNQKKRQLAEKAINLLLTSHLTTGKMLEKQAFFDHDKMLLYAHRFIRIDRQLQALGLNGSPKLLPLKRYFRFDCQTFYQYLLREFEIIFIVYSSNEQEKKQSLVSLQTAHDLAEKEIKNNHLHLKSNETDLF